MGVVVRARAVTSAAVNGPALRCIRERSGRSCSSLAKAVGVDVSFLARVERGEKRGVSLAVLVGIVRELEIADARAILVDPYSERVIRPLSTVVGLPLGTSVRTMISTGEVHPDRPQARPAA